MRQKYGDAFLPLVTLLVSMPMYAVIEGEPSTVILAIPLVFTWNGKVDTTVGTHGTRSSGSPSPEVLSTHSV